MSPDPALVLLVSYGLVVVLTLLGLVAFVESREARRPRARREIRNDREWR